MSVARPTFSESWHRVAALRPKLRVSIHTHRQQFRGQTWCVLSDAANNKHFRVSQPAYHLVALLNGRRTVSEAWQVCNDQFGDGAPTQGETIQLLGQLYVSNLLRGDLPPDAQQVFERHRKRIRREITGQLMNFLFVRIPLIDPQRFLQRWEPAVGWVFGPIGLILWCCLLGAALYSLAGQTGELLQQASPQALLKTENLLWLYASFVAIKALHELGHGFACVHFGRREGVSGAVHTMGIMLLVLMPTPYVDASSSWAFRSKWRRAFVGAAGMYIELAVAAVAAIVWSQTAEGSLVHLIAYNMIFIASVSTLLFNGNPLLRYDGYYILSDLLEIANLSERSKQYLYYLARKYAYGIRNVPSPAHTAGERWWFAVYAVAALIYRMLICVGIILFVADKLFLVGVIMAMASAATWVIVPIGKFVQYLATNPELERTRSRAIGLTVLCIITATGFIAAAPMPDRARAQGVVEPVQLAVIHMAENGWIQLIQPDNTNVTGHQTFLIQATNQQLDTQYRQTKAQLSAAITRREQARRDDPAMLTALNDQAAALTERLDRIQSQLDDLNIQAPHDGVWVCPDIKRMQGVYVTRGQPVGYVAALDDLIIRVTADQNLGPRIGHDAIVEIRLEGRPEYTYDAQIQRIIQAGQRELPSASLGYAAGGTMVVSLEDQSGRRTTEPFFEVDLRPTDKEPDAPHLWAGQRVTVRFTLPAKPLAMQWWRSIRQLIQRRYSI
ncbi:HlyD family efflux transporter periplasmic adaptor subunit [Planctomycetales bacterium ZRK34]|nr:HlyD family efflux transporter periplasmic adaptor subunit [Planctomycetales bacterium ZRK34]